LLEQSAQTMSFGSTTAEEKTVVLKSTKLYSGIRISFVYTDAAGAAGPFSCLENVAKLVVDVPEYGNNSRRVDLSGNTIALLPLVSQLGATEAQDAASAASVRSTDPITTTGGGTGTSNGFAYFDIPVNKLNLDEDARITINALVQAASDTLEVAFAFLDYPLRQVFFRAYDAVNVASHQQWFPADGVLRGIAIAGYTAGWTQGAANAFAFGTRSTDVTKISLNGEQITTYSNPVLLGAAIDEIVSGGPSGTTTDWMSYNSFGLFKGFPPLTGAQYISIDAAAGTGEYLIFGVMSDA